MNNYLYRKPFFIPWQKSDITYDAFIGLSLTLNPGVTGDVYLTYYKKENSYVSFNISIEVDDKLIEIVNVNNTLINGVSCLNFEKNSFLLGGQAVLIDTKTTELMTFGKIKISPLFIYKSNVVSNNNNTFINGTPVDLDKTNLNIENFKTNSSENYLYITADRSNIGTNEDTRTYVTGLTTDEPVDLGEDIEIVDKIGMSHLLIALRNKPNNICDDDLGAHLFDKNLHPDSEFYPLDLCFTSYGKYYPKRLNDFLFTSENLKITELSSRMGDKHD